MQDISGFGTRVRIVASNTFPAGFTVTQFADDGDSISIEAQQIAETAMGVNGDLVVWSRANPLPFVMNVIPGSEDDLNLQALLEANRVARGKRSVRDTITATVIYPDGRVGTWSNGAITTGRVGNSLASSGRLQSKPYTFSFEQYARS